MRAWRYSWAIFVLAFVIVGERLADAAAPTWQAVANGIELGHVTVGAGADAVTVVAVRVNPHHCALRVVDYWSGGKRAVKTAADACPKTGAALNAGFFDEHGDPMGLLIEDGKRVRKAITSSNWGVFLLINGHTPRIQLASAPLPCGVTQAVECKPRLVINGAIPNFKAASPTRRSAIGIDAQGRMLLAATDGRLTMEQWATCLRDNLGCRNALNLDGGPSTQLAVRGKVQQTINGGWGMPVFIIAAPKER